MANAVDAANYEILTLTKKGEEVKLEGKTTSFDYFESLLSPNITARMTFVDTGGATNYDSEYDPQERLGGIYSALPLQGTGDEEVKFKIVNSIGPLDFSQKPLFVNGAVNLDRESERESIVLDMVSESAITNQKTHVIKNYSQFTNNGEVVKNICTDLLKLQNLTIEATKNKYPFIGNNKSPFDVILMLAAKSAPETGKPGFFFYETKNGHNFRSIDSLISEDPVETYFICQVNKSGVNVNNDYKISSFTINKNQNLINALKSGVYSNRRVTFDPRNFELKESTEGIGELISSLGKSKVPTPEDNKHTRTVFSIKDVGALASSVEEGNSAGDPETWQGSVQMRYNLLFTQIVHMQVPCNPKLSAGDVVKCEVNINTLGEKEQGSSDPVNSGNYLILDLCHHYDTSRSFTSMTLIRDTYGLHTSK